MNSLQYKAYIRLKSLGLNPEAIKRYDEPHRFYHNWDHIESMLVSYENLKPTNYGPTADNLMFLAIVFHDIVYNPLRDDNEEMSVVCFRESLDKFHCLSKESINQIEEMIMDTKTHRPKSKLSELLCSLDLEILRKPLCDQIIFEDKIFKEYQYYPHLFYRDGRINALKSLQTNGELGPLIAYVRSKRPNIGIYTGTFNPFHKGHLDVLHKAEQIFDKVIIAQGKNPSKTEHGVELPQSLQFRQQEKYEGLITDFIRSLPKDANYTLIRGLRNSTDLAYEMTQYRFIQDLMPELNVTFIPCDKNYEHISSSAVRYLCTVNAADQYIVK